MSITQFICPRTELILRGAGAHLGLSNVLQQYGVKRAFLVSTPSLERNGLLNKVKTALGDNCVGVFAGSKTHTPESVVAECVEHLRQADADIVISFGGSSVVDLAKSAIMTLAEGNDYPNMKVSFSPETGPVVKPLLAPKLPHISIPTTLSASEFTFATVITDETAGEKNLYGDPKLTPKVVIQDTLLAEATPQSLWLSTGLKIVCDCVESVCSPNANNFNDAVGYAGLKLLVENLPASRDVKNHTAREACFEVCYMALGFGFNSGIGMVAALRHQLGGNQGVDHGIGSAIVLPHVLRFNRPNIETPLATIASSLGSQETDPSKAADEAIGLFENLIHELGVPSRLRDVNVDQASFKPIADHAAGDIAMANNPRPATSEQIQDVLAAAW